MAGADLLLGIWQGPSGHYVAHRDGILVERAGAGLAAAKNEMLNMVKQGDWAYSGNFVSTIKESAKAMKTMHEAKFSEREITCICCEWSGAIRCLKLLLRYVWLT